eukprot:GHVL01015461.1.p1 GENE.GHVL01015461.1~~GHVL01015461.1.p1  ORF type:complete len:211 (-),score=80.57 GHVL01015461.1:171-803(-)
MRLFNFLIIILYIPIYTFTKNCKIKIYIKLKEQSINNVVSSVRGYYQKNTANIIFRRSLENSIPELIQNMRNGIDGQKNEKNENENENSENEITNTVEKMIKTDEFIYNNIYKKDDKNIYKDDNNLYNITNIENIYMKKDENIDSTDEKKNEIIQNGEKNEIIQNVDNMKRNDNIINQGVMEAIKEVLGLTGFVLIFILLKVGNGQWFKA